MISPSSILICLGIIVLSPLFPGIINRTKAFFAGRHGPPFLQLYLDIVKLMRKTSVYSETTTVITRIAPFVILFSTLAASLLVPVAFRPAGVSFTGDIILLAYLLGIGRFFMVLAALDTGSAFEGMGAAREILYGAIAEPALFCGLLVLINETSQTSLSAIYDGLTAESWWQNPTTFLLIAASWMIILLVENARIPVDDPNTHLELTMIHEVMILDYSGKDLGLIEFSGAVKLAIFNSLLVGLILSGQALSFPLQLPVYLVGMLLIAVIIGVIESVIARFRLLHIPKFIVGSGALAIIALILKLSGN